MLVREVMTPDPVTVRAGTTVKAALRLLDDLEVTSLPVTSADRKIRGVVSEADLIRELVSPDARLHEIPVQDRAFGRPRYVDEVMTAHAITVRPETDLAVAVELVTSTGIKSLPVLDEHDRVVGIISRRDVVRMLARADDLLEQDVDALLVATGARNWLVDVHDGIAEISGPDSENDRAMAEAIARSVPGVVEVRVD